MGLRNVLVRAKQMKDNDLREVRKKSPGLSLRDAQAILDAVPGAKVALPRIEVQPYKILAAGAKAEGKVHGVSWRHRELVRLEPEEGRWLDRLDEREHAQVCVIGPAVRRDLFGHLPAIGRLVKINDVWFEVVGVLEDTSAEGSLEGVPVGSWAREIYVPVTTAARKFDREPLASPLDEIVVQLGEEASPRRSAGAIRELLGRLHGGAEDYEIVVPEALLEQSRRTQRLFNIVMGCIAGISLLVGGIGIMNIMLASVLERTREIGVRRAVGARQADIRAQFVVEAFAISALGGMAGVLFGVLIARGVAAYAGWPTVVTAASVLLSTGVSVGVGLASGIYPAVKAATLDPIEALRYE